MRLALRIAAPAAALIAALPSPASAGSGAMGISVGVSDSKHDYSDSADRTIGVWGRLALSRRISAQVELQKLSSQFDGSYIRSGTALIAIDLLARGSLIPVLLAGAGIDRVTLFEGSPARDGRHFEGGLGIEYRDPGGLFVGADVRLGGRSIENGDVILAGAPVPDIGPLTIAPGIAEGKYRALRVTAGFRF